MQELSRKKLPPNPDAVLAEIPEGLLLATRPFTIAVSLTMPGQSWDWVRKICVLQNITATRVINDLLTTEGVRCNSAAQRLKSWFECQMGEAWERAHLATLDAMPGEKAAIIERAMKARKEGLDDIA